MISHHDIVGPTITFMLPPQTLTLALALTTPLSPLRKRQRYTPQVGGRHARRRRLCGRRPSSSWLRALPLRPSRLGSCPCDLTTGDCPCRSLVVANRPCRGPVRGWLPPFLIDFAATMQQEYVERFYTM
ncbi:hypothetical protein BHM03_00057473 [Ensete ventricosum]|nr:hypothetical protein BHM03_00057473 [Ensete ventricosum]